ncbi:MAG: DUF4249 family protein [Bacteroidia bacterium]
MSVFREISTNNILSNSVLGATVVVSDGTITDTLQQIPGYGVYVGTTITGTVGKSYHLTVISNGSTITSEASLPAPVPLDSVWWKVDGNRDSLGFAWAHLTDPDTLGNCYRWVAQRINHYTFGPDSEKLKTQLLLPLLAAPSSMTVTSMTAASIYLPCVKFCLLPKRR